MFCKSKSSKCEPNVAVSLGSTRTCLLVVNEINTANTSKTGTIGNYNHKKKVCKMLEGLSRVPI